MCCTQISPCFLGHSRKCVPVTVCACVCVSVFGGGSVCVRTRAYGCVGANVCVRACVLCMCVWVCFFLCVYVFVRAPVCVCREGGGAP